MKTCRDCGATKPLSEFHRHSETRDRKAAYCKPCVAERVRVSRAKNPVMYARQKRDSVASARAKFEADPEPKRRYERERYAAKTESYRAAYRQDYLRNRQRYIANARKRKGKLAKVWTAEGDAYAEFVTGDPCVYCGGASDTVDHIVPISEGGEHTLLNLAPACRPCNGSKHTRSLLSFMLYRRRW